MTLTDWTGKFAVTSDNTKVSASVKGLAYDLSNAPPEFWENVKSDGSDIRITSDEAGTTLVARDVVSIDTVGETGLLRIDTNAISTSADTTYYIWSGNPAATEPGSTGAYDANLVAYLPLDEISGTNASNRVGTDGTASNARVFTSAVTGKLGTAADLTQGDDELILGDLGSPQTYIFWLYFPENIGVGATTTSTQLGMLKTGPDNGGMLLGEVTTAITNEAFYMARSTGGGTADYWTYSQLGFSNTYWETGWQQIAIRWDGSKYQASRNGGAWQDRIKRGTFTDSLHTASSLRFGKYATSYTNKLFMDELKVWSSGLTAEVNVTLYNNESSNDTFWATGTWGEGSTITTLDTTGNVTLTLETITEVSGAVGKGYSFNGVDSLISYTTTAPKNYISYFYKLPADANFTHVIIMGATKYVNNVVGTPAVEPFYITGNDIVWGKTDASTFVEVVMSDIRMFSGELTESQRLKIYNEGLGTLNSASASYPIGPFCILSHPSWAFLNDCILGDRDEDQYERTLIQTVNI